MLTRPAWLLRFEEAALLAAAIWLYMLGYLANPRLGSALYNLAHTLFLPLGLLFMGYRTHRPLLLAIAVIWIAHIAFDRMLGYGLKYPAHFKDTHLQHVS